MEKKRLILLLFILMGISVVYFLNDSLFNKDDKYVDVITEVCSRNIEGMAVIIYETSSMKNGDFKNYDVATGSKDNDFGADSSDGIILSSTMNLFLSIAELDIAREILYFEKDEYYMVQINFDFESGTKNTEVHKLFLIVDVENNHIIIPEYYIDPNKIGTVSAKYIEFESTEAVENLINHIFQL